MFGGQSSVLMSTRSNHESIIVSAQEASRKRHANVN